VKTDRGYMVPYSVTIPGTDATFRMQPIPGGKFLLGGPDCEPGHRADEGPQIEIEVAPFWMAECEVTWAEYKQYMAMHDTFKKLASEGLQSVTDDKKNNAFVVTAPSNLYDPTFTFKQGADPEQPAVTMSQYAAKQYTKWLSGITGEFYRLPGEAEWEYAARGGTKSPYSFGDNAAKLGDYAWYYDNSNETTHKVRQKEPNPFGLFDVHGNVGEWTLDQYTEDGYKRLAGKKNLTAIEAINWPTKLYPRVVRGGSWDEDAERNRSAVRRGSDDDDWRGEDPNFPQSPWWFTSEPALSVGMRIIRPLEVPSLQERQKFWEADLDQIREDVAQRIDNEGRGARGIADKNLPEAIKKVAPK
jgi:formylglycine-generating enzyme required for sulfatase activity